VAVSGDGRTVAAATAERLYIIRGGMIAAELDAPMVRSIALSWDGLTLAYSSDSALAVQRFKLVNITAVGYHLPVKAQVDDFMYQLPAAVYVSADASAVQLLPAQNGTVLCQPASNSTPLLPTAVVQYRTPYAVRLSPLA
jgi:hypothetical protein